MGNGTDLSASIASTLLARLKTSDEEAWEHFVTLYGPVIRGWLRQAGVDDFDARDLEQETLHSTWRRIGDFRRDGCGATFRGWLWTITQNKLRDYYRRQVRNPARAQGGTEALRAISDSPAHEDESAALPDVTAEEVQGLVRRALNLVSTAVSPQTWDAFWQTTVEGRPAAEVAMKLSISQGSVYTAKSRVLSRLRQILGDDCDLLFERKSSNGLSIVPESSP